MIWKLDDENKRRGAAHRSLLCKRR